MSRIGDRREMEAFVRSVELGSFSAAARELELTPSALSKLVTRLERALKVRLLSRSTRRIVPTPEGELFLVRCRRILAELEDAEVEAGSSRDRPRGRLRMHMGVGFGISQGVAALPGFFQRHPDVALDLLLEDRRIDLLYENVDISTWTFPVNGIQASGSLAARKLFDYVPVICASPQYLERHGTPRTPDDLARHRCMVVTGVAGQKSWAFDTPRGRRVIEVTPTDNVGSADCKYRLVLGGMGIASFSEYIVADALRDGRLVQVLADCHRPATLAQFALYPMHRHRLPRVAAMLDYLEQTFSGRPWRTAAWRYGNVRGEGGSVTETGTPAPAMRRPAA